MTQQQSIIETLFAEFSPLEQIKNPWGKTRETLDFKDQVKEKINNLEPSLQKRIWDELFHWGPLEDLKERLDIFDILIQGPEKIYFETRKGLQKHEDSFLSARSFKNFVERILQEAGMLVDQKEPFANGRVGPFRVHIVIPPASDQVTLTLRRHSSQIFKFQELVDGGFMSDAQKTFFFQLISSKKNFLVIGPTGSGKTTFLNSLIDIVDLKSRILLIEDTDELQRHHPLSCKLLSREICPPSLNVFNMGDLVKQALRMRPDRIVIGEVRGPEAKDLLMALATGHSGSMGTLHAESAAQALIRLEMLIQMGAPQWSLESIRRLILMSLDYLIVLKDDRKQKGIHEVCRISSLESFGLLLEPVKNFDNWSQAL